MKTSLTLDDIADRTDALVRKHGWDKPESSKPQTARNLAISISLEAAELLKCFQWTDSPERAEVADELADIVVFAAHLSRVMSIDLSEALEAKMQYNDQREW